MTSSFHKTNSLTDWVALQLADSAFPTGAFSQSGGLESAWHWGVIVDRNSLVGFIRTQLLQLGQSSVPFLTAAHRDVDAIEKLDHLCDAFLSNHVANRASRVQGRGLLIATEAAYRLEVFSRLRAATNADLLAGHLSPLFGVVTAALNVEMTLAVRLFLHGAFRDLISSSVRLNIIGPLAGQEIQFQLYSFLDKLVDKSVQLNLNDAAQFAPAADILQQTHDRLYSRLFQS
jgi:urease accessory protein